MKSTSTLLLLLAVAVHSASAQPAKKTESSPKRRAAAIAFAETHHPELAELLSHLQDRNPREYDQAVKQIAVVRERLARLETRDAKRYGLQLEQWKIDSRLRLLSARLAMGEDEALRDRIRELVEQRVENQLQQYMLERELLEKRLDRIQTTVGRIEGDRESFVDRETKRIISSVRMPPKRKPDATQKPNPRNTVKTAAPRKSASDE